MHCSFPFCSHQMFLFPTSYFSEKNKHQASSTCSVFNYKRIFTCLHASFLPSLLETLSLVLSRTHPSTCLLDFLFSSLLSRHLAPSGLLFPVSLTSFLIQLINLSSLFCTKQTNNPYLIPYSIYLAFFYSCSILAFFLSFPSYSYLNPCHLYFVLTPVA